MKRRRNLVAVVGRPNVGKSTLVNRLAARKGSIVAPQPGVTRDRVEAHVEWRGRSFKLADTGGVIWDALSPKADSSAIHSKVATKVLEAVDEASVILFVVDAQSGVTSDDLALVKKLRKTEVPIMVVANKADDTQIETSTAELWSLGLGEPFPVSALHGRGSGDLLDRIVELLPEEEEGERDHPAIAIVGRPNVGKSSLFNGFVGAERAIVHPEPGTTRDSIDSLVEVEGTTYRFLDTAGLRRRARTTGIDIYGASRTRSSIERADIAIIVIDAAEGVTTQDQRVATSVAEAGVGVVIAMNKWDLIEGEDVSRAVTAALQDRLSFVSYAPVVRTSAVSGRGVDRLVKELAGVMKARETRVPTAALNTIVQETQQMHPPPRVKGRAARIMYATQAGVAPPTFVLFASAPLGETWLRFLERRLREKYDFRGNPLKVVWRERKRSS